MLECTLYIEMNHSIYIDLFFQGMNKNMVNNDWNVFFYITTFFLSTWPMKIEEMQSSKIQKLTYIFDNYHSLPYFLYIHTLIIFSSYRIAPIRIFAWLIFHFKRNEFRFFFFYFFPLIFCNFFLFQTIQDWVIGY